MENQNLQKQIDDLQRQIDLLKQSPTIPYEVYRSFIGRGFVNMKIGDDPTQRTGTFTVTIASPAVFTATGHRLIENQSLYFTTTGALPTGLTALTTYYVIATGLTSNAFEVSDTLGGAAVNTSGSQSGVHTYTATGFEDFSPIKFGFLQDGSNLYVPLYGIGEFGS